MSLALITQPALLRSHFAYTRQSLLGRWKTPSQLQEIENLAVSRINSQIVFPALPAEPVERHVIIPASSSEVVATADYSPLREVNSSAFASRTTSIPWWKSTTKFILTVVMIVALGLASVVILPELYFTVFSSQNSVEQVANEALNSSVQQEAKPVVEQPYMPAQNPDLPIGAWVNIPRIGVNSELRPTIDPDEALNQGVWMVPDFGRPGDYTQPIILAAHRFGWDWWWQTDYWKYNSFYLLTDLQVGDRVEIIYDQRKWVYEIYAAEEGELISDYDADLILYTCKYLNSPIRYFRYAKVVKD